MRESAIDQAQARLDRARRAAQELKAAKSFAEAEAAWCDFLVSASTIYSKLLEGSKGIPKSAQWFAEKKGERRKDPLLKYLHFARNSDEHGIEHVVTRDANNSKMAFNEIRVFGIAKADPKTNQPIEAWRETFLYGPHIKPVTAYDRRFNTSCDPPKEHLGKPIHAHTRADSLPDPALAYLEALIAQARKLV